ncbi:VTT domain-containing protein [Megasphaera paucivorans]|uniref:TVP38/TMEM64 family membrane protein n=1 Tax=Megasphaera paucivorans TaxID=349095 RepID=A0A1H0A8U7_9FIRM|nr:VTT domain-containing protein [Megasphaera paucivorans]SDN29895.1 Uncharacterized membrane protein YdjX, TVP38/TMEM64 family, SNARE-associated domain [Megasphaera paucivorans]
MIKGTTLDKVFKGFVIAVILFVFAGVHFLVPGFYSTLFHLTMTGNMEGLVAYITSFGYWAVIISVFMIIITNMTGLPSIPFLTVNGVIFGLVPGIIISWIGEVIGIDLGFVIMRNILREKAQKLIEENHMAEKLDQYSNIRTMTFFRAIPYTPNVLFTAIAALSRISLRDHTISALIGKIPAVIVEVWLGHDLLKFSKYGGRFLIWVTIASVAYLFYRHYKRKKNSNG